MKKLIIQIPCFNEEEMLGTTLNSLPKNVPGIDIIEYLIIDDGSTDKTVEIARSHGAHHIVSLKHNQGLAKAFKTGLDNCLKQGADIIVNTDADNQYCADDIDKLVEPILKNKAEIVIGARPISGIEHFSFFKKIFQKLGSWLVRQVSNTKVVDAPSGFRAISREAAMKLNVFSEYTYTLETIIQAGQKGMAILSVPIRVNGPTRPSRLFSGVFSYISRSAFTIIRIFITYRPFKFFFSISLIFLFLGFLIGLRFLWFYFTSSGAGHIQSLILAAVLMILGFFLLITGVLADIISVNRKLLEKIDERMRYLENNIDQKDKNNNEF